MPIQSAIALVGLAKQSAKGSAAASPTFGVGVTDGTVVTVEVAQEMEERTSATRISEAVNRTGVMPGIDYSTRAFLKTTGLALYAALGNKSVSGAGPYTHIFTSGADDLPYLTAFGQMGSSIYSVQDTKVDSLGLSFEAGAPVTMAVSGMGTTLGFPGTFTPTVDESLGASYFTAVAGTFKLDTDSATAVTANIKSGEISISNALESIMLSGSISPSDIFPGRQEITCSFDVVPDDLADWRTLVTGTSSGTTASAAPLYGSFEIAFTSGTASLTLAATRVAFTTDFPSANAGGGPVTLSLAGIVLKPSSGAALTATLVNGQTTY